MTCAQRSRPPSIAANGLAKLAQPFNPAPSKGLDYLARRASIHIRKENLIVSQALYSYAIVLTNDKLISVTAISAERAIKAANELCRPASVREIEPMERVRQSSH